MTGVGVQCGAGADISLQYSVQTTLGLTYLSFRAKIKNVWKLPPVPHASWCGPSLGTGTLTMVG